MPTGPLFAAIVIAGVATGVATHARAPAAMAIAIAAASALAVTRGRTARGWLFVAAAAGAVAHGAAARDRALSPSIAAWFDRLTPPADDPRAAPVVEIDGHLLEDAVATAAGVRLVVAVARVRDGHGWHAVRGRVQAHVAGELAGSHLAAWTAGRPIRAPALLRRPQVWRNFGGPGERWQQLTRPFDLAATIKSAALVVVAPAAPWHEAGARARQHVRGAAVRLIAPRDPEAAAIAVAILIGDRAGLDDAVERRLQIAGTYHVIAISGGNVALLTAMGVLACRAFVRGAATAALMTLGMVLAYGGIVGGDPSVSRAVLAASVYLAASALGVRPRPLYLLATVAVALAVIDPLMVIDVGAWLSFGATLGIIACAVRVAPALGERLAGRGLPHLVRVGLRPIVLLGLATVAAELALLPIAAAVFHRVSIAGLLLNFVAIPAMAVVQLAGIAVVMLDWTGPAAQLAAVVCTWGARALVDCSHLVDVVPWLSWRVPPPAWWWLATYYTAMAVVLLLPRARRMAGPVALLSLVVIVVIGAPRTIDTGRAAGLLRMVLLDVGQGEAILLQTPSRHAILIDAGGTSGTFDIGGRVVAPVLWAHAARRLDVLAVTHPDQDHLGGAATVVEDFIPREIWEGVPVPKNVARAALRERAVRQGAIWRAVRAGESLEMGGVRLDVLHPPAPDWERQRVRNDDSIVLRVRYGDVDLLLTGDAGSEFERLAPNLAASGAIRVLKAGHHGSRTSSSEALVRAYRPDLVLISAGRGNLFGHPAPEVLARAAAIDAAVFRTDRDGAIRIETDGRAVYVETAGGRRWMTGVLRLS